MLPCPLLHFGLSLCILSRVSVSLLCVSVGNARVIGSRRRRLPTHSTAAALSRRRRITSRLHSRRRRSFLFHLLARILLRRKQKAAALQLGRSFRRRNFLFSSFLFSRRIFLLSFSFVLRFGVSFIRLIFRVTIVNPLITGLRFFPFFRLKMQIGDFKISFVSPRVKCQLLRRRNWNWAAT